MSEAKLPPAAGSAWKARGYRPIPGPECRRCYNTGYTIMHGAPLSGRTGLPMMNDFCAECGRDPNQFLRDEVIRKASTLKRSGALDRLVRESERLRMYKNPPNTKHSHPERTTESNQSP